MRIKILSDIHLEVAKNPGKLMDRLLPSCPDLDTVLVLAGDIGHFGSELYMNYITKVSENYQAVFVVLGNHEYYQSSIEKISDKISSIRFPDNVHVLNRNTVEYRGIRFIGCTLWASGDASKCHNINDFYDINGMTPDMYSFLNKTDIDWLANELSKKSNNTEKTIVITHHLPSESLVSTLYKNHPLNVFYANDLDSLVNQADIWICGHTHIPKTIDIGKCHCIVNPIGYQGENTKCNFDFKIDTENLV